MLYLTPKKLSLNLLTSYSLWFVDIKDDLSLLVMGTVLWERFGRKSIFRGGLDDF